MTTRFKLAAALALSTAFTAAPALAQEMSSPDQSFDRASHFDGVYVSGTVGLAAQNNDRGDQLFFDNNRNGTYNDVLPNPAGANAFSPGYCSGTSTANNPAAGCRGDRDKMEFAARIGVDGRFMGGNGVAGGLIEVSGNHSTDGTSGFSTTPAGYSLTRRLDYAISARGRFGYTPNGGALFYVTGGPSYARINHGFTTTNTANSFTQNNDDKMVFGGQVGGGAAVMFTDHVSLGLEYLFNSYRDRKYFVGVGAGTANPLTNPFLINGGGTNIQPSDTKFEFHSLRATISYQF